MKTLIIYNDIESELKYLLVEGDYRKFDNVIVNSTNGTGHEDEFIQWFFKKDGDYAFEMSTDKSLLENKEWDKAIITTFLP